VSAPSRRFVVFGFSSVHDALGAEAVLKAAGLPVTAIPSPRELGELCGIAMRVEPLDADEAERTLTRAGTQPKARTEILDF
jgi:putative Se/S carrier protein